ncbi:MAG: ATP-binding protein [Bradymonadaceae bacterium]
MGVFLVPTLTLILIYGLVLYFSARQELEEELGRRLVAVGQAVAADMSEGIDAAQIRRLDGASLRVLGRLQEKLVRSRDATEVRRIFLFDREHRSLVDTEEEVEFGRLIYQLDADSVETTTSFEEIRATVSPLFAGVDGTLHKTAYVPVTHEGEVVAVLGVQASADYFALLTNFASILLLLGGLGLGGVVLSGTLFARRLTRPLNELVQAAKRLGRGELSEPVSNLQISPGQGDEIDFLGQAFEEMRRNIVQRDEQMQMMLSGIAHEVRNPLGGMELFCGLLKEDLEGSEENEDQLEMVHKIQHELIYLEKVVKDFLDFAREVPLQWERFGAQVIVEEVASLLARELDEGGCVLVCAVEPGELELTADRERLRRAIINVIRNAYQACEGGGEISVEVAAEGDGSRRITIKDNGPGIAKEKLDEICQPFFTTREKGSGLGLSLTRQIIDQHGGRLTITSEPGEGTTVSFLVPFKGDVQSSEATAMDIPEGWLG